MGSQFFPFSFSGGNKLTGTDFSQNAGMTADAGSFLSPNLARQSMSMSFKVLRS
jgi:hypothetical protein